MSGDIPIQDQPGDEMPDNRSNKDGGATLEDLSNMHNSVGGSGTASRTSGGGVPIKTWVGK